MTLCRASGFTLLELMVVLFIAGLLLVAVMPASLRFYDSLQYRGAVREMTHTLQSARYAAINSGRAQDVLLYPETGRVSFRDNSWQLPEGLPLNITSAVSLNRDRAGVVRFYPDGGSSGADIVLGGTQQSATLITVDWLLGSVSLTADAAY